MTFKEIYNICKRGKIGMIPNWKGYLLYNYALDELLFVNNDFIMNLKELEDLINNRTDLYYII